LKGADLRTDVSIDVAQIRRQGRRLNVDDFEVPVHQLIDRGARSRVALLVHLAQEPRAYLLSPGFSLWPGRDDLGQQQFFVRNTALDGWSNGVWNQVFAGDPGAPAGRLPAVCCRTCWAWVTACRSRWRR
jgi:hypothetical protein